MGFNGDLYPTAGASVVMTTTGDLVRYDSERERLGIGSTNEVLTVVAGLPAWATASGSDTPWTEVHDFDVWYYDMQIQSKPSDPSADNARFYVKEIDSDNDGLFCIIRKNGAFEETQIA